MLSVRIFAAIVCGFAALAARADTIAVPNYSFEQPPVPPETPAYPGHVAWQQTPKRADYVENPPFTWNVLTGVFPNTAAGSADHIDNMDGTQAAYLFAERENGVFQVLPDKFTTGFSYTLTVGVLGSANVPPTGGTTLELILYYTNAVGIVPVASKTVTYDEATFPNGSTFRDFTVKTSALQSAGSAVNQQIGILIKSSATDQTAGGVWDIDNVRLTATREFVQVPNFSFENPTVPPGAPAYPVINNWQKFPQPSYWDESTMGAWTNLTGVFPNPPAGEAGHIDNLDRNQAAYLFATPGDGIFQDLTTKYEAGSIYKLTVGVVGSSSIPPAANTPISIALYYRDAQNQMVTIAKHAVPYTTGVFSNFTRFVDISTASPRVTSGDPWLGKNIGVMIFSEADQNTSGGVWDIENVRLTIAPELTLRITYLGSSVKIEWESLPNTSYVLQRTTDFVTWQNFSPVLGDGNTMSLGVSIDEPERAFFRMLPTPLP